MITYCLFKFIKNECIEYDELAFHLFLALITVIVDILLLLIQPILYFIVKSWEKENE